MYVFSLIFFFLIFFLKSTKYFNTGTWREGRRF